jgi:putative copper resistance protein D
MGQHMLLQLAAPPLILLGAPMTLLLRSNPPWPRRKATLRFLRSKTVAFLTHPVTAFTAFTGSILVAHFTPLYELALGNQAIHIAEHVVFLGTGLLYWAQVVESDPLPHRQSAPARLLYLFLVMPVMAIAGSALAESSSTLYHYYAALPQPWGGEALVDQHRAGAMMWEFGIFVIAPVMGRVLMQWLDREERDRQRYELGTASLEETSVR